MNIKAYRKQSKITQTALAEKVCITRVYLNNLENGIRRNPSALF